MPIFSLDEASPSGDRIRTISNNGSLNETRESGSAAFAARALAPELRLRRVKSTSRAQEIVTEDEKQRRAQPDKPIHRPRDSLFSWAARFQDFEGVMNWAFLMLTLGGFRLALENLNKYGIRVDPGSWLYLILGNVFDQSGEYPTLYLLCCLNFVILWTLVIEKGLARKVIGWSLGMALHIVNLGSLLAIPPIVIRFKFEFIGPANATIITAMYTIVFLKMYSYAHVNYWCRSSGPHSADRAGAFKGGMDRRVRSPSASDFSVVKAREKMSAPNAYGAEIVHYPDNLTVGDIYYFWLAPTLCYELNFPRNQRIRKSFLLRRGLEVLLGTHIVLGLIQQWIIPSVVNSLIPFSELAWSKSAERVLKIAVPNHLIWLTLFYLLFHSFLNSIGEIMHFSDREFYRDWWNASNLLKFWKDWNIPVHRWCVRHLFKPMLQSGYSMVQAQIAVFFFSAVFHEFLISVPLVVMKPYAFLGMVMQIPLIFVSIWLEREVGPRAGNILMWLSLLIGHPMAVMMYYHDYVVEHYGQELIQNWGSLNGTAPK